METIEGKVTHIRYKSPTGDFSIFTIDAQDGPTTVVGNVRVDKGLRFEFVGKWVTHKTYGLQFSAVGSSLSAGVLDKDAALLFLKELPQIGEVRGKELLLRYSHDELFDMIENNYTKLAEVEGINEERAKAIHLSYESLKSFKDSFITLTKIGANSRQCAAIKTYVVENGVTVEQVLENNPYILLTVGGLGFSVVDRMALDYGMDQDDPRRAKATILHFLNEVFPLEGHCFAYEEELIVRCSQRDISYDVLEEMLIEMAAQKEGITFEEDHDDPEARIYSIELYDAEMGIAQAINHRLADAEGKAIEEITTAELRKSLKEALEEEESITLHEHQHEAVEKAISNKISVITGGPGTGKTTCLSILIQTLLKHGKSPADILCCAPTGKAAVRMKDQTGEMAHTIHRALGWQGDQFVHNTFMPLPHSVVIVDEVSMVDVKLMYALLSAITKDARIVLVGDVNQLPSIGPGCVFSDIIESGHVPVTHLTHIFRQSEHSWISVNAKRIIDGEMPVLDDAKSVDFFFVDRSTEDSIHDRILDLTYSDINLQHAVDKNDVQVLCPQKDHTIGIHQFNESLQVLLNPPICGEDTWFLGEAVGTLRTKDKVMQTRNNYDLGVMNGEVGIVDRFESAAQQEVKAQERVEEDGTVLIVPTKIEKKEDVIVIKYPRREVTYTRSQALDLRLAYAITIHKSQGSEYDAVVIPIHSKNKRMLKRRLIYTAITRGKKIVYLVGSKSALKTGINNIDDDERNTRLKMRIGVKADEPTNEKGAVASGQ